MRKVQAETKALNTCVSASLVRTPNHPQRPPWFKKVIAWFHKLLSRAIHVLREISIFFKHQKCGKARQLVGYTLSVDSDHVDLETGDSDTDAGNGTEPSSPANNPSPDKDHLWIGHTDVLETASLLSSESSTLACRGSLFCRTRDCPVALACDADQGRRFFESSGESSGGVKASSPSDSSLVEGSVVTGAKEQECVGVLGRMGDQCSQCQVELEEGQCVVMATTCSEMFKIHKTCFEDDELAFDDEGGVKFPCDCGQLHLVSVCLMGPFRLQEVAAGTASSNEEFPVEIARASLSPAEVCMAFTQVDPLKLAVVDGRVVEQPLSNTCALSPLELISRFRKQDLLSVGEASSLLRMGEEVLSGEPNMLDLHGETILVGDLHGQYFDLLQILDKCGQVKYLFMGDYVDRGDFSCEVFFQLLAMKLAQPQEVYLLRGNHETANQTASCGFKEECLRKYGKVIYKEFLSCFRALPVCALLHQQDKQKGLFCVHGGLSPQLHALEDVQMLDRRVEPEHGNLLMDLLWADPSEESVLAESVVDDGAEAEEVVVSGFRANLARGCSFVYDSSAAESFLEVNNLRGVVRAHSVQGEGFRQHFADNTESSPSVDLDKVTGTNTMTIEGGEKCHLSVVTTVFSAPGYEDCHNLGAVLRVKPCGSVCAVVYDAAPQPAVVNSTMEAVRKACPYMPTYMVEWADLVRGDGASNPCLWVPGGDGDETLMCSPPVFSEEEGVALRKLWEAMSNGDDVITDVSLFLFDDATGGGISHWNEIGAALRILSGDETGSPGAATTTNFLLLAQALKSGEVKAPHVP